MQNETLQSEYESRAIFLKTLLLVICISISLFGWLRFSGALRIYGYLLQLGFSPHPIYYVLSGLAIGISFLLAVIGSALKIKWAFVFLRICSAMLAIHLLIENFFLRGKVNITQAVFVMVIAISIFLLTPKIHDVKNEHNHETFITGN